MSIQLNAVSALAPGISSAGNSLLPGAVSANAASPSGATPFSDLLKDSVAQVNQLEDQARVAVTGLMTGSGVDIHQAMIATQKASMAFELSLAVRNKAVQAYQQVMNLQF